MNTLKRLGQTQKTQTTVLSWKKKKKKISNQSSKPQNSSTLNRPWLHIYLVDLKLLISTCKLTKINNYSSS